MIKKLNYDPLRGYDVFSPQLLYDKIDEIIDAINKLEGGEE